MGAARAIQVKLKAACGGRITPDRILSLDATALRACGLSRQKSAYVHDLARHYADGVLSSRRLRRMTDDEVIAAATAVKGIGRWTAEMLLMFCLERPDVWPIDDLGLRKAVRNYLGIRDMPTPAQMRDAGEPFRPYRTYASWYLWRSLEGPFMPGVSL
jgi:DNA-3-methyladenine glycosylase II